MTKVRIKKTGEIVNVASYGKVILERCNSWGDPVALCYDEVEFIQETPDDGMFTSDYWEKLRHKYAGMAMQTIIPSQKGMYAICEAHLKYKDCSKCAVQYADALIEELKNK